MKKMFLIFMAGAVAGAGLFAAVSTHPGIRRKARKVLSLVSKAPKRLARAAASRSKPAVSSAEVSVWAIDEAYKVSPQGAILGDYFENDYKNKNFIWDAAGKTVSLFGAKNETIAFQLVVEAGKDLSEVSVSATALNGPGTIDAAHISLFKEHYTPVTKESSWPKPTLGVAQYPDALIPFDIPQKGSPFSIAQGKSQAVWVDIRIPADVPAGTYTSQLQVAAADTRIPLTIQLIVWDFAIPDTRHLKAWTNYNDLDWAYGVKSGSEEFLTIEKNVMRLFHEHRVEGLHRYGLVRPALRKGLGDTVDIDWQPYDRRLGAFFDGTLFDDKERPNMFLYPVNTWPGQRWPADDFKMRQVCREMAAHFKENGWDSSKGYVYLWDEPEPEQIEELKKWAQVVKEAVPELKTTIAFLRSFNRKTVDALLPYVDLWQVDASKADLELMAYLKKQGKEVGFYQQGEPWCGNESLDNDGIGFRTWPWIAAKYDIDVIYMYIATNWWRVKDNGTIWNNPANEGWSNSQGVLIYPGKYLSTLQAVGSIRLKQFRRGMQDYEYIELAKQKSNDARTIVDTMIPHALTDTRRAGGSPGEWPHDPKVWHWARMQLARLIQGLPLEKQETKAIEKSRAKEKILYACDFEDGKPHDWSNGKITQQYARENNAYSFEVTPTAGQFSPTEHWKKIRVNENSVLSFSYYCVNTSKIIVNLWSSQRKKNLSGEINAPRLAQWTNAQFKLADFLPGINESVDSIHIAVVNGKDTKLIIDDVKVVE